MELLGWYPSEANWDVYWANVVVHENIWLGMRSAFKDDSTGQNQVGSGVQSINTPLTIPDDDFREILNAMDF